MSAYIGSGVPDAEEEEEEDIDFLYALLKAAAPVGSVKTIMIVIYRS